MRLLLGRDAAGSLSSCDGLSSHFFKARHAAEGPDVDIIRVNSHIRKHVQRRDILVPHKLSRMITKTISVTVLRLASYR